MTNEEFKEAIELVQRHQDWRRGAETEMENPKELGVSIDTVLKSARELLQLKDGTHPDMVLVPRVTMLHARHYLDGVARDAYDSSEVCEIIYNIDKAIINAVQKGSNND